MSKNTEKEKKIEKGKDSLRGLNPERFLEILNKKKWKKIIHYTHTYIFSLFLNISICFNINNEKKIPCDICKLMKETKSFNIRGGSWNVNRFKSKTGYKNKSNQKQFYSLT